MDRPQLLSEAQELIKEWGPILDHEDVPSIDDPYKKAVTAILLENQRKACLLETSPVNSLGNANALTYTGGNGLAGYDPILISLVRRAMPNLIAYDVASVQPMNGPTGLVFAMRAKYVGIATDRSGATIEALFNEPQVQYSGSTGTQTGMTFGGLNISGLPYGDFADPLSGRTGSASNPGTSYLTGTSGYGNAPGMSREIGEDLGGSYSFKEMAFTIDKTSVTAKTRALKAEFTTELQQDLKAIHGLDAEQELSQILTTEILAEINREMVRHIYRGAKLGCQQGDLQAKGTFTSTFGAGLTGVGGEYDLVADSDGRWSAERWRGLMFQIEREANVIGKETRRGKGNFCIVSADVASALAMGGFLNLSPALNVNMQVDDNGNLFAGVLNGKMKVFIDPFSGPGVYTGATSYNFVCIGYKGSNPWDAGIFYCPYVPLQMVRAVDEDTFQPKIGFKTRYGVISNPFVAYDSASLFDANRVDPSHASSVGVNQYFRLFRVTNLHGNTAF